MNSVAATKERAAYRSVRWGVDRLPPRFRLSRHPHRQGYATVILSGGFIEASFAGRFRVGPGDVLLHTAFDCHSNFDGSSHGLTILRLPWRTNGVEGRFRFHDPDLLARLCEQDPDVAAQRLARDLAPVPPSEGDWPQLLASAIAGDGSLSIGQWADAHRMAPETVSRGFSRAFGVTPRRYRLEMRTRRAWKAIMDARSSLTDIAHDHEFSDLAHLSRCVRSLTGAPPSAWKMGAAEIASC